MIGREACLFAFVKHIDYALCRFVVGSVFVQARSYIVAQQL